MDAFRQDVHDVSRPHPPTPIPTPEEGTMLYIAVPTYPGPTTTPSGGASSSPAPSGVP